MSDQDSLEMILDPIGQMLEFVASVGPWVLAAGGVLFLIVFGLALTFIVSTWRSINRDHARMDARWGRASGRGYRG